MLRHAFKEWAVICRVLANGWQSLILRKGGILEVGTGFQVEHQRFWLFPTYLHQNKENVVPAAWPLFEKMERDRPPADIVRLTHFVEVSDVYQIQDLKKVPALGGMHFWSDATVEQRFHYRRPGLFALVVRMFQVPWAFDLPNTPYYEGCKSWVELERALPTENARPVVDDATWEKQRQAIQAVLNA